MTKFILILCILLLYPLGYKITKHRPIPTGVLAIAAVLLCDNSLTLLLAELVIVAHLHSALEHRTSESLFAPFINGSFVCLLIDLLENVNPHVWIWVNKIYTSIFSGMVSIINKPVEIGGFSHPLLMSICMLLSIVCRLKTVTTLMALAMIVVLHVLMLAIIADMSASKSPFGFSFTSTGISICYMSLIYMCINKKAILLKICSLRTRPSLMYTNTSPENS